MQRLLPLFLLELKLNILKLTTFTVKGACYTLDNMKSCAFLIVFSTSNQALWKSEKYIHQFFPEASFGIKISLENSGSLLRFLGDREKGPVDLYGDHFGHIIWAPGYDSWSYHSAEKVQFTAHCSCRIVWRLSKGIEVWRGRRNYCHQNGRFCTLS